LLARPETRLVLDATVGAGGHAEAILKALDHARLIGMDRDESALAMAAGRLAPFAGRVTLVHADYSRMGKILDEAEIDAVDAILMDLGVSSMQLDDPARGFSFLKPGPLDMRMDRGQKLTAEEIVNGWSRRDLINIFRKYGEEPMAGPIAAAIERERAREPVTTTDRLAGIVAKAAPGGRRRGIHPATRVFQAIRIAVNGELDLLGPALETAVSRLAPGGRLVVISFHSLEDRIVKTAFAGFAAGCVCPKDLPVCGCGKKPLARILTRKPARPDEAEAEANPRARSARLRALERLAA